MPMQVTAITHKRDAGVRLDHQPGDAERIERDQEGGLRAAVPRATCATSLAIKGVRRVVMHERLTNLRPVIFLQFADGTPRTEVWRGAARRRDAAVELRQDRHRGQRGHRSRQAWTRCCGRSPIAPIRSRTCSSCRIAAACRARNTGPRQSDSGMLIDATRKYPMAPLALPTREYMEHARALWEELDLLPAQRAVAVARLQPGRLDRPLGDLRAARRRRRLGTERPRHAGPPARRTDCRKRRRGVRRPADRNPKRLTETPRWRALPYLDRADLQPEHQDLLGRATSICYRLLVAQSDRDAGLAQLRAFHPAREPARSAPARARHPAGRLSRTLALRIFASHQDRPRLRRQRRRYPRHRRGDRRPAEHARCPEQGGAARRPRDDAWPLDLGAHVSGAAPKPRQRTPHGPRADDRVLQFGGRILATLQIDVEDDYQQYLDEFPLPPAPGHGGA